MIRFTVSQDCRILELTQIKTQNIGTIGEQVIYSDWDNTNATNGMKLHFAINAKSLIMRADGTYLREDIFDTYADAKAYAVKKLREAQKSLMDQMKELQATSDSIDEQIAAL